MSTPAVKTTVKRTPKAKKVEEAEIIPVAEKTAEEIVADIDFAKMMEDKDTKPGRYYEAVGRRKTATARVRLFTRGSGVTVNRNDY